MIHKQTTIDYGKIERYIEDRGFGFVSQTFAKIQLKGVFFHIKVVKRTHPNLAGLLDSTTIHDDVFFWYEYTTSPKGQEVLAILDLEQIQQKYTDHKAAFIDTIKTSWMDVKKPLPKSLKKAASDLLTSDEINQLTVNRETLEAEQRSHQEELQKAEDARLQVIAEQKAAEVAKRRAIAEQKAAEQKAEDAKRRAIAKQMADQQRVEEEEFRQLVAEMSALRYTHSSQVSAYIVNQRLGYKYKNISGILQMELNGNVWDFDGGFPPNIYRRLCNELGLRSRGSGAVPGAFTPYRDIELSQ